MVCLVWFWFGWFDCACIWLLLRLCGCLVLCLLVVFVEVAAFVVDFVGLNALGLVVLWVSGSVGFGGFPTCAVVGLLRIGLCYVGWLVLLLV